MLPSESGVPESGPIECREKSADPWGPGGGQKNILLMSVSKRKPLSFKVETKRGPV